MASNDSKKVVYAAIAANLFIAVCKYIAAALTLSSAMLAEAVHSTVDTGNELLLLLGMRRSSRPPDSLHPFGHGKVLYFYSLLVAVYIFGAGASVAFYQGISHLLHPRPLNNVVWNYAVLAVAGVLEFYSWRISYKALVERKDRDESVWDEIIGSKDPTIFTIFLEDSAALIGAFLAFLGIFLGQIFHNLYFDPGASIAIGLVLTAVAILLARESGALLVGERTNRKKISRVRKIIAADSSVEMVNDLLTMQLGPEEVLLNADVKFRNDLDVRELESAIERLERKIREGEPSVRRIFIEAHAWQTRRSSSGNAA